MANVEGLSFSYVLHELPRDRLPFRRWRFELWHGARLEAAGWRTTERDALRALHKHGSRVAHRMFGLRPPAGTPVISQLERDPDRLAEAARDAEALADEALRPRSTPPTG